MFLKFAKFLHGIFLEIVDLCLMNMFNVANFGRDKDGKGGKFSIAILFSCSCEDISILMKDIYVLVKVL